MASNLPKSLRGDVSIRAPPPITPDDFVPEMSYSEDRVHKHLEIVAGIGVTVQVDTASRLEYAVHFKQADCHHCEVRLHTFAMRDTSCVQDIGDGGLFVGYQAHQAQSRQHRGLRVSRCP